MTKIQELEAENKKLKDELEYYMNGAEMLCDGYLEEMEKKEHLEKENQILKDSNERLLFSLIYAHSHT